MKIILSIVFIATLNASALTGFGQHIDLKVNNTPLKSVFRDIQKQTDYDILYVSKDLEGTSPVSVNFVNKPLKEALTILLKEQPISFEIDNKTILITRNPKERKVESRQERTITGRVSNAEEAGVIGASIRVKGTAISTVSDLNGNFSITIPNDDVILEIRSVGWVPQDVPVKGL
ncbi:MAG TPA: carboxypeptidase-like regulatory domain-containing protein, partial [Sphingobacterium sp.]|nr:carboxypeptidase-like regulatory domain-containing protein [Sphingobacterium sp.]